MHVTQTNPFPGLVTHYDSIRRRAAACPKNADNIGKQGRADWLACMNGQLWLETERMTNQSAFSERRGRVHLPTDTLSCVPFEKDLQSYCDTMTRDNCIKVLDYTVKLLRDCDAMATPLFTAEDQANNDEAQKRHDDECRRRYP
ncbi:MAG TPA: hypothetical protein VMZ53_28040 [Kofleriaceae bacterium]|nr:hypothetical protein [Kofleriaceae bacterium]